MHALRHQVHTVYKGAVESVMSVRTSSAFVEKGVLTPEEFVAAGDFLVSTCPTWSWEGGDPSRNWSFLPPDKQFLVTRNVPCLKRAAAMEEYAGGEKMLDGDDDGWVATGEGRSGGSGGGGAGAADDEDVPDMASLSVDDAKPSSSGAAAAAAAADDDDDIPDMDDYEDGLLEVDEATALPTVAAAEAGDNILKTRTYDISITYDKYYQTPRVWLNGYDEHRLVLKPEESMYDVSAEHSQKTVTIDPHPHTGVPSASIHPCKHGNVMKKLIDMMAVKGEPNVEHYLFVFLKFISSVIPTIEYDYTTSFAL